MNLFKKGDVTSLRSQVYTCVHRKLSPDYLVTLDWQESTKHPYPNAGYQVVTIIWVSKQKSENPPVMVCLTTPCEYFFDYRSLENYASSACDYIKNVVDGKNTEAKSPQKSDGGPSSYYNLPTNCVTLNDILEWKGRTSWLGDSFHLANVMKAAFRWGEKAGTSKEYDARKFIYSGARLLQQHGGQQALRATLQAMLNDKQFGGPND